MSEKMRGAIFSALGDIDGLSVLDAYSGSGAISFEAISRGATSAVAVEADSKAARAIKENVRALGLESSVKVSQVRIETWHSTNNQTYDLVFADPPYDDASQEGIEILAEHLSPGGVLVLSWPGKALLPDFKKIKLIKSNNFGDAQIAFYSF